MWVSLKFLSVSLQKAGKGRKGLQGPGEYNNDGLFFLKLFLTSESRVLYGIHGSQTTMGTKHGFFLGSQLS